jgi:thioredoxin 1
MKRRNGVVNIRLKICITVTVLVLVGLVWGYAFAAEKSSGAAKVKAPARKEAVSQPQVTFIEIGAAKCIPCKMMQPIMKEVAEEYKGQVNVLFYDVWTQQGRIDAEKYNIRVIPTQVFLDKDGKEYFRHEGYFPKEDLVKILKMQRVK